MITLNVVAVLCRTWSLRPRLCPPCPRLPPQTVWATWATSRTVCRTWFPHCRDRTLTCPPNNPTCPASSPCINRSAIMLTSLQTSYKPLCFFFSPALISCVTFFLARCPLLVAPRNSSHPSNSSRFLRLLLAAQRHSSSLSTDSHHTTGSWHTTSSTLFCTCPHSLWTLRKPSRNTHTHTSLLLAVMLWQCKLLWWCCRTVAVLASSPPKCGRKS